MTTQTAVSAVPAPSSELPVFVSFCQATVRDLRALYTRFNANGAVSDMRRLRRMLTLEIECGDGQRQRYTRAPIVGCDAGKKLVFADTGSVDGGSPLAVPKAALTRPTDWDLVIKQLGS